MKTITDTEIKEFLETVPLYTWIEYEKATPHNDCMEITEIDSFCDTCGCTRPFQSYLSRERHTGSLHTHSNGVASLDFVCVSCQKEMRYFHLEKIVKGKTIKLQKYGELPRKKLARDSELQTFFSDDSEYYEKAVVCISNGYGIAAFAYYRRIIENNIHALLKLLKENLADVPKSEEILVALTKLEDKSSMSEKIKVANNALPDFLKPDGINPLGALYRILSEGVHSLTDLECLHRAEQIDGCIKFLINELSSRKKNLTNFKGLINDLTANRRTYSITASGGSE